MQYAIVKGDDVALLKSNTNVKVNGEMIGNIDLLTRDERKKKGIYEIVDTAKGLNPHYYAASYIRTEINHDLCRVFRINEIITQPVDRIAKHRMEEAAELKEKYLLESMHKATENFSFSLKPTAENITRLENISSVVTGGKSYYFDDCDDNIVILSQHYIRSVYSRLIVFQERVYNAYHLVCAMMKEWPEEENAALVELDLEEVFVRFWSEDFTHPLGDDIRKGRMYNCLHWFKTEQYN